MKKTVITAAVVLGAVVVVYLMFELLAGPGGESRPSAAAAREQAEATGLAPAQEQVALPPGEQDAEGLRTLDVTLYFSRPDALGLAGEIRPIFETRDVLDQLKQTVAALIAGPAAESPLLPVLPPETALRGLYLDARGTLYLDLGQSLVRNLLPGSTSEMLAVGGLTNTLSANFPAVKRVQILVEGEEVRTLTGHLDLSRPVPPDTSLIVPPEVVPFTGPAPESGEDRPTIW